MMTPFTNISEAAGAALRIAYVCREFGSITGGGIGTYIEQVSRSMVDRGHQVFLITDCFTDDNRHHLPDGIELVNLAATRPHRHGSFVSGNHEYSYRVYDTLTALTRKIALDVIEFAEFGVEGFISIRAKRLLGMFANTKLVVKLHTPSSLLYRINEDRRLHVDSLCDYYMEDYCVKHADMVTSPSLSLGDYFVERVGRKDIKKCPYPLELPENGEARTFTDEQIRRVRLIGSIQVRKGVDTFIGAAIEVLRVDPGFVFEIWGADRNAHLFGTSYTDTLQRLIPEEFRDRIRFAGTLPYSEIPPLFQQSCFCVYPSRWENWANVCLEAMSSGCIVLGSREGGMSEMIEHEVSGFVINPLDSVEIAGIIIDYAQKPERLAEISMRAVARSREICDPLATTRQIEENYRQTYKQKSWRDLQPAAPLVSVIIPFFNQPEYVEQAVESVRRSAYPAIEIIVVNDGSTTAAAIEAFDSLTGVVKLSKENGGLSSARNAGIAAATGVFILPLDADDLLEPSYIAKGVSALLNNPDLGYVSCHAQNFGELHDAYIPVGYVAELMPYTNTHGKCSNIYRRELFCSHLAYDEVMTSYEDWDLLLSLHERGFEGDVLPAELFYYRRHFDSMVYTTANRQRADLIQYMMIKHEKLLTPQTGKMAIMLARLWKQTEAELEFAEAQLANAYLQPASQAELQSGGSVRLQVYSRVNEEWWEHNSVYVNLPLGSWQRLRLNLPFTGHDGLYRIDPANRSGTIVIRRLVLRTRRFGRRLLYAHGGNDFAGCRADGSAHAEIHQGFLVLRAFDEDPQVILDPVSADRGCFLDIDCYVSAQQETDPDIIIQTYRKQSRRRALKGIVRRFFDTI
ncbi:MAG: glycosyltransferase [Desulfofustis sp. PB-SRB1]|jgi:glycosyltransferase involved in cell wall biosynthesis|nr:glycosyltransferase [Desulfofustis sp. PB-SRB1]MBM1001663.1 glycosyltransferase [Desulfofustis sp. PB-SRB1]